MSAYSRLVVALRFPIVLAWIVAAIAAHELLPSIESQQGAPLEGLVASDSEAARTEARSARLFDVPVLTRTVVVDRNPDGLPPGAEIRALNKALDVSANRVEGLGELAFALPISNRLGIVPGSRERSTTLLTYLFFPPDAGLSNQNRAAHIYAREHIQDPGGFVGVTGAVPARLEQFEAIRDSLPLVEQLTVLLIALIVGINFRAPGAPFVTLVSAGLGYVVAIRVVAGFARIYGVDVPREVQPLILVLLLGIVTDYSIFFLSGLRRLLSAGEARLDAARQTVADFTPIVLTAGLIVASGTAAILVGRLEFFRAFGPGVALAALVGVLVAVTFVPALLAILGRSVFWPSLDQPELSGPGSEEDDLSWRTRAIGILSRRRAAAVVAPLIVALLLLAASGIRDLQLGFTLVSGLPADAEARVAAEQASRGFAPGMLGPGTILVEAPNVVRRRRALSALERAIEREPGVSAVIGPRDQPTRLTLGAFFAKSGNAARYLVILEGDPGGGRAIEHLSRLQRRMPALAREAGLGDARIGFAGDTALAEETVDRIRGDLERIAIAVLAANFVFLLLFLRAVVATVYLLAASVLALAAALGVATYVFQDLLGHDELTYYVPFAAAVLLVSLGSDYNIFVAGRVWDEARRRPLSDAVAVAAPRAARAIAVASIALAASFAVLAVVPLRPFREFAFIMVAGVLIDSFVVRSLLVPALITLFGDLGTWPRRFGASVGEQPPAEEAAT